MKKAVVRNIPSGPQEAIDVLRAAGVATVHEAMDRSGLMQPYMRPINAGAAITATAVTTLVAPSDNWMTHVGMEQCKPGNVLVVGVMTENTDGMVGDLIFTDLQARGVLAVVIDAACRDVHVLKQMSLPVWSRAFPRAGPLHKLARTLAHEALQRIGPIFAIEADIQGQSPEERSRQRRRETRPILDELQPWMRATLAQVSTKSLMALAIG